MRRCAAYPRPRTKFFRKQVSETAAGIKQQSDFSKGSVSANILSLALPLTVAQLINVLYNVVDRIYIGHIPGASSAALTGVGVTFPILSIVIAFANLFGTGGAPLFSIARGRGDDAHAADIMGNTFTMLLGTGLVLTALVLAFKKPLLYLFGASDATFPYADGYLTIYLCGTVFVMLGLGMNNFINAQGFGSMGMITVLLGAVVNIILDPVFIFALGMGVQGAALATVISQFLSALWAVAFLCGKKALLRLRPSSMRVRWKLVGEICALGLSGFIMSATNSAVQVVCNATLHRWGGDGCDDGTQLGAGDYHNARHGHYQCRAARHRLQFWRRRIQTRAFRHSIHECGLRWVHSRRMAVPVFVPAGVYPPVYFRPRLAGRRRSLHARLFFRIFYDGTAVCRTVHQHGAWTCQTGCFFLAASQGCHRHPTDAVAAGKVWSGCQRCFSCGTYL